MANFYDYLFSVNKKVVEDEKSEYNAKRYYLVCCKDGDNKLRDLINYIGKNGNGGHSFDIVVDPDRKESERHFFWDGDGSDRIISVSRSHTGEDKELIGILLESIASIDRETWIEGNSETVDKTKLITALSNIQDISRQILEGADFEDSMKEALREVRFAIDSGDTDEQKIERIKAIVGAAL